VESDTLSSSGSGKPFTSRNQWSTLAAKKRTQKLRIEGKAETRAGSAMGSRVQGQGRSRRLQGKPRRPSASVKNITPAEYALAQRALAKIAGSLLSRVARPGKGMKGRSLRVAQADRGPPIPVFFKGRDGNIREQAWRPTSASSAESFIGKTVQELFSHAPDVAARHRAADEDLWRQSGTRSYELQVPIHDGSVAKRSTTRRRYRRRRQGRRAIGTIIDITERQKRRASARHRTQGHRLLSECETVSGRHAGVLAAFANRRWRAAPRWSMIRKWAHSAVRRPGASTTRTSRHSRREPQSNISPGMRVHPAGARDRATVWIVRRQRRR